MTIYFLLFPVCQESAYQIGKEDYFMKKNMLTKSIIFVMTMALTIAPMSVSATVRDNAGGGTLEGKTDVGSLTEEDKAGAEEVDWMLPDHWVFQNGKLLKGTMTDNGAVNKTINAGVSYTVPKGYHDGTGVVKAASLASQTEGTATSEKMLADYTAWVNGSKVTGTMTDNGGSTTSATTVTESGDNALITIPIAGYYDASSKLSVPIETLKNEVSSLNSSIALIATNTQNNNTNAIETVDVKSLYPDDYQTFTIDNFIIETTNWNAAEVSGASGSGGKLNKKYDATTGKLTYNSVGYTTNTFAFLAKTNVYLVIVK